MNRQRLLIVDDHIGFARRLGFALTFAGIESVAASSVIQAMHWLKRNHPLAIVADAEMPGLNGFHLLGQVRRSSLLDPVPVIVTASHDSYWLLMQALDAGADHFLPKPFAAQDILDSLVLSLPGTSPERIAV
jgi:two-component system, OmpR family, KDP operon response regulator KdpE